MLRSTIPYNIEIKPVLNKLPMLNCYPGKVNQVLMNLINNSIQAIKEKGQIDRDSIEITTTDHPENITIEITDTGIGMSSEVQTTDIRAFLYNQKCGRRYGAWLVYRIRDNRGPSRQY